MNLIEAWKKAKEGQNIVKGIYHLPKQASCSLFSNIKYSGWLEENDLLSDDWQIESIKHEEVYEDCYLNDPGARPQQVIDKTPYLVDIPFPLNRNFTMTIEYEE